MGKVTYEFDENKESHDIELIVNRYKMIFALDELEKYRHDLYNGHCEDVIYVRDKDYPLKNDCIRYVAKPEKYQSYFEESLYNDGKCDCYRDYKEYDENLDFKDWKLISETKALLYNIFKKYLATSEQKEYFIEKEKFEILQLEQEKSKKYASDIIFKNKTMDISNNKSSKALIEYKEKWYNKIFNFIKKLFKRN